MFLAMIDPGILFHFPTFNALFTKNGDLTLTQFFPGSLCFFSCFSFVENNIINKTYFKPTQLQEKINKAHKHAVSTVFFLVTDFSNIYNYP